MHASSIVREMKLIPIALDVDDAIRYGYTLLVGATVLWGTLCMVCESHLHYGGGRGSDNNESATSCCHRLESFLDGSMEKVGC